MTVPGNISTGDYGRQSQGSSTMPCKSVHPEHGDHEANAADDQQDQPDRVQVDIVGVDVNCPAQNRPSGNQEY